MCGVWIQPSSTRASRTESESSAPTVAELAGKLAGVGVVDSCRDDASLPDTAESAHSSRDTYAAEHSSVADSRDMVDKQLYTEDTVVPSPDEHSDEGMYT